MFRWCASHSRLVMFLSVVPTLVIFLAICVFTELPPWTAVLFVLYMLLLSWGFVNCCARQLITKAERALREQCDPYPLLIETQEQLAYVRSKTYRQILLIDYCAALRYMGEYGKVLELLESINIDKYPGTLPLTKAVYYINLTDIYLYFNNMGKAEFCQHKSIQLFNDFKNRKQKNILWTTIQYNAAEIEYLKRNYEKAIEILSSIPDTNLKDAVCRALSYAKILIAQGRNEEAKEYLDFVIDKGNSLVDVQTAKRLLTRVKA